MASSLYFLLNYYFDVGPRLSSSSSTISQGHRGEIIIVVFTGSVGIGGGKNGEKSDSNNDILWYLMEMTYILEVVNEGGHVMWFKAQGVLRGYTLGVRFKDAPCP
ncbi:hypothetical protein RIF29_38518 [Crotalaria pallida]|uniref:Uncharacterized protein n=1 Tax=Crotalaria pallida TaxID=3830 RepID=A0AAN9HSG1_CROPI